MGQAIAGVFAAIGNVFSSVGAAFGIGGAATATTPVVVGGLGYVGGATVTAAVSGATFTSTLAQAAVQLAVSAALQAAFRPNLASTSGAPMDFKADPGGAVPHVINRTGTGGSAVYAEVFGGDQARFLRFVTVLSAGGPIEGVESFTANGRACTFDVDRNEEDYYHNIMYMDYKLGAQPETAHTVTIPPWGSTPSATFTSDHKLSGMATAQWVNRFHQTKFSTGVATPIWVILGAKVYDPREDSTYPGGSGSQRWDDQDSWSFAGRDNPHLQAITWMIGRESNGKICLGGNLHIDGIDLAPFVEGANISEANGWTIGGVVYSSESKWGILEAILRAGGARPIPLGAIVSCVTQAPRVSIATLTSADLDGEPTLGSPPGRRDRFNTARPRYREEDLDWAFVQSAPIVMADALTEDGETRTQEIDFGLVQDKDQAAQLAAYDVLQGREAGPHVFPLRPRWMGLKPGDAFDMDDEDILGFSDQVLIFERQRDVSNGSRILTCWTETAAKHDLALAAAGAIPDPPTYEDITDDDIAPPDVGEWTVIGTSIDAVLA